VRKKNIWQKVLKYQNFYYLREMKVKNKIKNEAWITIKIDPTLYDRLREYCNSKGLKIGHVAGKAIEKEITVLNLQ